MSDELAVQENNAMVTLTPVAAAMRILGANKDFDVDKLGAILELQIKHEGNEARKVFARDFAKVQASVEDVIKTKRNQQTNSNYAALEDVVNVCKPVYTEYGFSVIFYEGESTLDKHMRICADVLHRDGHKETYHYDNPLGGKGIKGNVNMTEIHGKATSVAYGRRYLLCMIWNIPTVDNDGNQNPNNKEPEFLEPVGHKKQAVDKAFDALLDSVPDGKVLNYNWLCRLIMDRWKKYPATVEEGKKAALKIVADELINFVCEDKK